MKTRPLATATACIVLSLSACRSMSVSDASTAMRSPVAQTAASDATTRDAHYMSNVERQARDRGILVQWIHPPVSGADAAR